MIAFENIISLCKTENIRLLLIAGDLFENINPDIKIIERVKHLFKSIPQTFIAISAGNHDCFSSDSVYANYSLGENVHIFTTEWEYIEFKSEKTRLWGCSFENSYRFNNNLKNISVPNDDYTNIMLLHADIVSQGQTSRYNPINTQEIENTGMDYIALGHIHKRTPIVKAGFKTFFAYSGCPEGRDFGELGEKGVYIGEVFKNKCNLNFHKISIRMCIKLNIDITNLNTEEEIIKLTLYNIKNKYGIDYSKNLYQINLVGNTEKIFNTEYISSSLKNNLYEIRLNNNIYFSPNIIQLSDELTLKGCFVRKMLKCIENSNDEFEIKKLQKALYIGLEAFEGSVTINEN